MRIFSSTVMAVLMIAVLFWGNCFSCPQLLLAQPAHPCCPHTKSPAKDCNSKSLQHFVKADSGDHALPAAVIGAVVPNTAAQFATETSEPVTLSPTPPLLVSLRI